MGLRTNQGKAVRRRLFLILAARLAVYSVAFALFTAFVWHSAYQQAAYVFADIVSPWEYVSEDEWNSLKEQAGDAIEDRDLATYAQELGFWSDGNFYAVRSLTLYHTFLGADGYVLAALFVLGAAAVAWSVILRSARYVDELSAAVSGLFADKASPVELPDDLAATRAELFQIQNRALADERAAEVAETRKNELVAYLAHDIRTPLTSVMGYLAILKDSPELPLRERADFARIAYDKAEFLDGLVEEFFEITRYNLQAIPIERERIDLGFFCRQVAEEFIPEALSRNVRIEVDASEDAALFADPDKLARAVSNVLRNAVSYARSETIVEVKARVQEGVAVIEVSDDGKEISPEHLDAIFEKFFREDASRMSDKGSAGLGLAIAKEIIEAHGGSIQAESSGGRTVFKIILPR